MKGSAVLILCASLACACGSETPTSPSATATPSAPAPPPPALPAATDYRLSGIVTSEKGAPITFAAVTLTHVGPDLAGPGRQVETRTGSDGRYEFLLKVNENRASITARIRVAGSESEEYRSFEQALRLETSSEKNIRVRAIRTLTVGGALPVSFDADSSDCPTIDPDALCEWVRVRYPPTFTDVLDVAAHGEAGGVPPTIIAHVPSLFGGGSFRVVGRGFVSLPIGNEDWPHLYAVHSVDAVLLIPRGMAPQRYEVTVR